MRAKRTSHLQQLTTSASSAPLPHPQRHHTATPRHVAHALPAGAVSRDAASAQQRAAAPATAAGGLSAVSGQFSDKVPRAGFPLRTGKVDVARLCYAGHQVAVVLQRKPPHEGAPVTRYVAQICTPHSPYCELAAAGNGLPTTAEEDRPVWGVPSRHGLPCLPARCAHAVSPVPLPARAPQNTDCTCLCGSYVPSARAYGVQLSRLCEVRICECSRSAATPADAPLRLACARCLFASAYACA